MDLFELTRRIRKNEAAEGDLSKINGSNLTRAQVGSLLAAHDCINNKFQISKYEFEYLEEQHFQINNLRSFYRNYSSAVSDWGEFSKSVSDFTAADELVGYWLMSVTLDGLDQDATTKLTRAMSNNGHLYEYQPPNSSYKLIRRYPTGALSEKLALIMPILIAHLCKKLDICAWSPFLIARVLGHTGGTRDKLSAFPGFKLPLPGDETLQILRLHNSAYVATESDFNPTDNRLYSLRSETDTIESLPLIVSSIASKMLACPVDLMQIDVRWGQGAFFATYEEASDAAEALVSAITSHKMRCFSTLTEATHPTGSFIGAHGEVAEAVQCMGGGEIPNIDNRMISLQRLLAADFTSRLLSEVSGFSIEIMYIEIMRSFTDGSLGKTFIELFQSHNVSPEYLEIAWENPMVLLRDLHSHTHISSSKAGRLKKMDQHKLGRFVSNNFQQISVQVHVKPGDYISIGTPLCSIFSNKKLDFNFEECFWID